MLCKISYRITKVLDRKKAILGFRKEISIPLFQAKKLIDKCLDTDHFSPIQYRTMYNPDGNYVNDFPGIVEQYNITDIDTQQSIEVKYRDYFTEMGKRCFVEIEPIFEHEMEEWEKLIELTPEQKEASEWFMKLSTTEQKYVDTIVGRYRGPTA
jgi:hypothetical protein